MAANDEQSKTDRRTFLQQCGRFAVVTPPVVSLMLSVSDKAGAESLATSGRTTKTTHTTSTKPVTSACTTTKITETICTTPPGTLSTYTTTCQQVTKTVTICMNQ